MLTLTKTVPAKVVTLKIRWVRPDFMLMGDRFRQMRLALSLMDTCFWCDHKFINNEMMALASREKNTNIMLCQSCAAKAEDTP